MVHHPVTVRDARLTILSRQNVRRSGSGRHVVVVGGKQQSFIHDARLRIRAQQEWKRQQSNVNNKKTKKKKNFGEEESIIVVTNGKKKKNTAATTTTTLRRRAEGMTRTIVRRPNMSTAAKLDHELMTTHVDPVILKRTVHQEVRKRHSPPPPSYESRPRYYRESSYSSPPPQIRRSSQDDFYDDPPPSRRARSPLPVRRSRIHDSSPIERRDRCRSPLGMYASQRVSSSRESRSRHSPPRKDEYRRRRTALPKSQDDNNGYYPRVTESSSYDYHGGYKVVVNNLQGTVTQQDIIELFGDIGPLKRARITVPGTAEIIFINGEDAHKAVQIYHNRQLDGKAMKCIIIGSK